MRTRAISASTARLHAPQVPIKGPGFTGSELLPGVHLVASHLDRVWLGTHNGAIRRRHFDAYLDEFVSRFNRRTSKQRGLLFYRLMEGAVATDPAPFPSIRGWETLTPRGIQHARMEVRALRSSAV